MRWAAVGCHVTGRGLAVLRCAGKGGGVRAMDSRWCVWGQVGWRQPCGGRRGSGLASSACAEEGGECEDSGFNMGSCEGRRREPHDGWFGSVGLWEVCGGRAVDLICAGGSPVLLIRDSCSA